MNRSLGEVLNGVEQLYSLTTKGNPSNMSARVEVARIVGALNSFSDCVRYLNTRRSSGALLKLENEAAVQDALYLMLRPWITDLVPENPTDRVANRFSIKDFISKSSHVVIEAKYVRSADHGRVIARELNDDIETYRYNANCDDIVFFIYDPDGLIPDAGALERHLCSPRTYGDKLLRCHAVIKP
jgi:hypothetical protein